MKENDGIKSEGTVDDLPLISVIVPVYQVEDYLEDCIQSLCVQSYNNIEILLIDDGSTDGSAAICDRYARKDARIRVLHQENKGLSGARNQGLCLAKGEYIAFVDSDDCVSPVYLEKLYRLLCSCHAEIAVCDYASDWNTIEQTIKEEQEPLCLDAERMLREWHGGRKRVETVVWNKLYGRQVLLAGHGSQALFPEGRLHEDVYVSHWIMQNTDRIALTSQKLYMYRRRGDSLTHVRVTRDRAVQNLEAQTARLEFFCQRGLKAASRRLAVGLLLHFLMYDWKLLRSGQRLIEMKKILPYLAEAMR